MKNGNIGIIILFTILSTIAWNWSKSFSTKSAFVHPTANPKSNAKANALITLITGGISNLNISSGNSFNDAILDTIDNLGINAYPAIIERIAAKTEDK